MDYPKFIVSNQKEESISIQRVKSLEDLFKIVEVQHKISELQSHFKGENYPGSFIITLFILMDYPRPIDTISMDLSIFYPPTKSDGYSFGVVRPSRRTFCLSGTISQYLLVRFNSFLVQMISTMDSRYPIGLVRFDPLTFELLPLFKYRQL